MYGKNPPTYSFYTVVGAVFAKKTERNDYSFKDIICISETPGWQQLNKPYLQNGEPVCGEGTTKYE